MSRNLATFGQEAGACRKRVLYTAASTRAIQQGEPMCYIFDSTTNLLGWSGTAESTTTAEGGQNEGKYMRVQSPDADNLMFFAGVVAEGSWCGQTVASGASEWIEVYEPTGAIVPVRTSLSCTVGVTVLAIKAATYTFTNPVYGGSTTSCRAVALAEETVDRSSTNGLVLARLDPDMFVNQGFGVSSNQLVIGEGATTGTLIPNFISLKSTQTGGDASALRVRMEAAGAGMNIGLGAIRAEGVINAAVAHTASYDADGCAVAAHLICKTGCTPAAGTNLTGVYAKLENQDSTPADLANANISALTCVLQNNDAPTLSSMMRFVNQGTDTPDYFFVADSDAAVCYAPASSISNVGTLKIRVGGEDKYIVLSSAA